MKRVFKKHEIVQLVFDDLVQLFSISQDRRAEALGRVAGVLSQNFLNFRANRISLVVITQLMSVASKLVLGNSETIMVTKVGGEAELRSIQNSVLIPDEQKDCLSMLEQGKIMLFQRHVLKNGAVCRVEPVKDRVLSENERLEIMKPVLEKIKWLAPQGKDDEIETPYIKEDERKWLFIVYVNQYRKTKTELFELIGFSKDKGTRTAKRCEDKGFTKTIEIVKGKGVSKYPVLLEPTYSLFDFKEKKFYGKGAGYEHVAWQHIIAEHFNKYRPVIELNTNDKFIDVALHYEEKLVAVEVAMTAFNERINVEKDFNQAGVDFVIIGCKDKKVKEDVEQKLSNISKDMRNKTEVCLLSEILKEDLCQIVNGEA